MSRGTYSPRLKISDVARLADVSVSTIRVWEAKGLLKPSYSDGGRRLYTTNDVEKALQIKRMRSGRGMPLTDIASTLKNGSNGKSSVDKNATASVSDVGPILRKLRTEKRLTLKEVADAVELTPAELASTERTSMGLDVPALKRLATFFGTTLNGIMGAAVPTDGKEIVTRDRGVILPRLGVGLMVERFGSGADMMDCQRWTIEPGVSSNGSYRHEGEEFIAVLSGTFEITLADERVYVLTQGDTIYFKSGIPHSWRNPGPIKTEMIWICAGHSF